MANEDYIHIKVGADYEKVIQQDGVRTTVCENRYEILVQPTGTVPEQQAIQQFRDWIRARNAKVMQGVGRVSE